MAYWLFQLQKHSNHPVRQKRRAVNSSGSAGQKSAQNHRLFTSLIGLVAVVLFLWAYKNRRNHLALHVMLKPMN
ncbi:MAG: heme A synthase [Paraglaciecola sp.]|jgi:heme A synthase